MYDFSTINRTYLSSILRQCMYILKVNADMNDEYEWMARFIGEI